MSPLHSPYPRSPQRVPRASGDEPEEDGADADVFLCSPRERG